MKDIREDGYDHDFLARKPEPQREVPVVEKLANVFGSEPKTTGLEALAKHTKAHQRHREYQMQGDRVDLSHCDIDGMSMDQLVEALDEELNRIREVVIDQLAALKGLA